MGDTVQAVLDRMVPDLEDLNRNGVFTKDEVRAIAARRRDYEYLARRRQARKVDFLRYIEYELNLEELRKIRRRKVSTRTGDWKKDRTDYAGVQHIHAIFQRACHRFPGDIALWLQHVDFAAKQSSTKALSRIFARALQLHPRNSGLWIKAASWEFFECSNAVAARVLLQRALRINPATRRLWVQYMRLEWCYLSKVAGRRQLLGLEEEEAQAGGGSSGAEAAGGGDGGGLDIPQVAGEDGGDAGPDFSQVAPAAAAAQKEQSQGGETKRSSKITVVMPDATKQFYKGGVPLAIFRAATKSLPHDIELRADCLRVCCREFPSLSGHVQKAILQSLVDDFPTTAEAWAIRAQHPLLQLQRHQEQDEAHVHTAEDQCMAIFESAVHDKATAGPDLWLQYSHFLHSRIAAADGSRAVALAAALLGVLKRGVKRVRRTATTETDDGVRMAAASALPELAQQYAMLLLRSGDRVEDCKVVLKEALEACPANAQLALFLACLLQRQSVLAGNAKDAAEQVLRGALKALQPSPTDAGVPALWRAILELHACAHAAAAASGDGGGTSAARAQLKRVYREAIGACAYPDHGHHQALADFVQGYHAMLLESEGPAAATAALEWCCNSFGLRSAKGADGMARVWQQAIRAQTLLPENQRSAAATRRLYETAVDRCGHPELWSAYREFEVAEGKPQAAASIVWRAQQLGITLAEGRAKRA